MYYKLISPDTTPEKTGKLIFGLLKKHKVVHVLEVMTDNLEDFYNKVAEEIGIPAPMEEDPKTGNKTGVLHTHVKHPWHKPSNSYSHSNTRQPLHTDGSYESEAPNITYFSCKKAAEYGGATKFIDNCMLVEILEAYQPNLLKEIRETPVKFFKGNDSKTKPIITKEDKLTWNWHRCEKTDLTKMFHGFLERTIVEGGLTKDVVLSVGDALFFRDEEVLHGRNSFVGSRWLIKGGIHERSSSY